MRRARGHPLASLIGLALLGSAAACAPRHADTSPADAAPALRSAARMHTTVIHSAPGASPGVFPETTVDFAARWRDLGSERAMESDPILFEHAFFEALVSINADVPGQAGMMMEIRFGRTSAGTGHDGVEWWSPYLTLMRWGENCITGEPVRRFRDDESGASGVLDVDYFRSNHLFDRVQYRIRSCGQAPVRIERVSITVSSPRWTWPAAARTSELSTRVSIDVPFRSQKTPDPALAGRLCSPTSVAMMLAHRGVDASVQQVAALTLDSDFQIYGNWPRNIQAAYALGVPGHLTRYGSWRDVERTLAAGQPIIASIIVDRSGDLHDAPYETTSGHLIVLTGLTESGDVLVNDPAVGDAQVGRRVYRREDLSRVWLANTQGTSYILLPREHAGGSAP